MILKCRKCDKKLKPYEPGTTITISGIFHTKCLDPKLNERIETLASRYKISGVKSA